MSSCYMFFRSSVARRRICQAAGVIAVSLLWTGGPARVLVAAEEVSLRGAVEETHEEIKPLPEDSELTGALSSPEGSDESAAIHRPTELVCDAFGEQHAVIRSTKDNVKLSCRGGFAVYDVPNVGEVFEADCRRPKALEVGDMKAALDHNVDDTGAFRILSVSNLPAENEQFCLACAMGATGEGEVPENEICSVVVTVVGTNNKDESVVDTNNEDELPAEEQLPGQEALEQVPKQEPTSEQEVPQQQAPEALQQVSPPPSPQVRSSQQHTRPQRPTQRVAPRQPQQQAEQLSEGESQPSQADAPQQPLATVEEQEPQRNSRPGEQQQAEAQQQRQDGPAEERQDKTTIEEQLDTSEDSDSSEEEETGSKPALQCTNADLHLSVSAGESISFTCGNQMSLTPETNNLVYEEGEGKCGKVKKPISDLVPEAQITKDGDATVVSVALGASEDKTVCYKCVGSPEQHDANEGTETEREAHQPEECVVFITLKSNVAAAPVIASGASTQSSSFLVGAGVFLSALLLLLQ